jgi:Fe-S-cluster containining protein
MIHKDTELKEVLKLAAPCMCNSCRNGCKYGSGFLVGNDSKNMAKFLSIPEADLKRDYLEEVEMFNNKMLRPKLLRKGNNPYGRCIYYDDEKGCMIHQAKPLQCRTSIACKGYGEELSLWFMVNYIVDAKDPKSIEEFSKYLKYGGKTIEGASVEELKGKK